MNLLNILQHSDGTTAWDNLLVVLLAFVAGWLLHRVALKKKVDEKHRQAIAELETKCKKLENEYKNYKSNIAATEKHHEKAVIDSNARVKTLEGDIRALAEEKSKVRHLLTEKDQEIRRLLQQLNEKDDAASTIREAKAKADEEWTEKLRTASQSLARAITWEDKAKQAESEAARAKDAIGHAERKKLEAELRLKAVSEYAGKIGPLQKELEAKDQVIARLQQQLQSTHDVSAQSTPDMPMQASHDLQAHSTDDVPEKIAAGLTTTAGQKDTHNGPTGISSLQEPLKSDL
jgi:chromosome segregation ATPase